MSLAKRSAYKNVRRPAAASRSKSDLQSVSTGELAREMARREREVRTLQNRRTRLAEQLAAIDAELEQMGATSVNGSGVRRRPRNKQSLAEALAVVLKSKTMSVTEAADAVRAAGYQSTSSTFRTIVNQTLLKDERFEKVERGRYRAKK